jgi:hypothetical protein
MKMSLNKDNVLRVITSDDHVVHVKEKSSTMRRHVDKKSRSWALAEKPATVTTEAKS